MATERLRGVPQIATVTRPVPHQVKAMGSIAKALRAKGVIVRETYDRVPPEPVVFAWSWKWCKEILDAHPDTIVCTLDHGLFVPRNQTAVTGWFGLNGLGEHAVVRDGGARLRAKGWDAGIKPWRTGGKTALLVGQCYNDVQILDHLEDYGAWLCKVAHQLTEEGWRVMFRPHPVQRRNDLSRYPRVAAFTSGKTLQDDLDSEDVGCVVGFNSNACLDAFMAGVPDVRVYNRGSMLWPIVKNGRADPQLRQELANMLAWCQWEPAEIENGEWAEYHVPIMQRMLAIGPRYPWHDVVITPETGGRDQ